MIAILAASFFGITTLYCLGGWCIEAHRNHVLRAKYKTLLVEGWMFEHVVRFAGRCAWHATNDAACPPQHLVAPHMVEHYAAGFEMERAAEDLAAAGWNGAMGRTAE